MIQPEQFLNCIPDAERARALERFHILRPFLEDDVSLTQVAKQHDIPLRTAQHWVMRYREQGLSGLCRKEYAGKGKRRLSPELQKLVEGFALQKPPLSVAAVHRKIIAAAAKLGERAPSYSVVYALVRRMAPALITLAHEGTKAYSESFDLVHRTEAEAPNVIWQADHT